MVIIITTRGGKDGKGWRRHNVMCSSAPSATRSHLSHTVNTPRRKNVNPPTAASRVQRLSAESLVEIDKFRCETATPAAVISCLFEVYAFVGRVGWCTFNEIPGTRVSRFASRRNVKKFAETHKEARVNARTCILYNIVINVYNYLLLHIIIYFYRY